MKGPRHCSTGFAESPKHRDSKTKPINSCADHITKEHKAAALINQGKIQEAEAIYKELITAGTRNHIIYGNLATIYGMQSKLDDCIKFLRKALEIKPNFTDAHNNLGNALKLQGELPAAINSYSNALKLKPDDPDTHMNLGIALKDQGDLNAAIDSYNKALELKPNYPEAHFNLGITLKHQGDLTAAITSYKTAVQLKTNFPEAHLNLGVALKDQGDLNAAIDSYNKALELKPNYPEAHFNLGIALKDQGNLNAAIDSYNKALDLKPNYPEAHFNLGVALKDQGDLNAAIDSYNKALELKPNYREAHNNLGALFGKKGKPNEAINSYKQSLKLKSDCPEAHYNIGNAFQELGDINTAIDSYNTALGLNPNYPEAHWNYSLTLLLGGDYKKGWDKYEWRTKRKKNASEPHALPKCDQWSGEFALKQIKQLLLVSEQGLGDTLQFMRYATALKNEGISISLCAQPKLHSLIQTSGIDPSPLTPKQANQVTEGHWIPLLSVPRLLKVSPENPIITEPYIKTTEELTEKWSGLLDAKVKPIVGINWQGNPKTEERRLLGRSLTLEAFAPITGSSQISLVSLQKGFGSEQLETCSFKDRFVSCQDQINETWDFLETAAIIANCDLIITSDTSVAHLAGGMGKTTWLLLKKVPEWRWGLEGDTTFWYPSMRLFRQDEQGDWNKVMERVAEALQEHFGGNSTPNKPAPAPQPALKPEPIQDILAPISLGELIDKITILHIKTQHLQGTALENVKKELHALETTLKDLQLNVDDTLIQRLKEVNQGLWQIEDDIRDQERQNNFGETFIRLARSVYQQNDQRAAIKKEINTTYGSDFVEEKSYHDINPLASKRLPSAQAHKRQFYW